VSIEPRQFDVAPAPHVAGGDTVAKVMGQVLIALVPAAIVHVVVYGPGLLLQLGIAGAAALAFEAMALRLRKRALGPAISDASVLVTAALLAFSVPPLLPWWCTVIGIAVAVLMGKHVYGGLGHNPFNPAMVGYAALLISFPVAMTRWPLPASLSGAGWSELAQLTLASVLDTGATATPAWDAYTGATALDTLRTSLARSLTMQETLALPIFGRYGGIGSTWISVAALVGGLFLLARRVIRWQIPVAVLLGVAVPATVAHALDPGAHAGATFHLLTGATMLGAFFIATDPVSAATSPRGRLIYGAGIGFMTWLIRSYGSYADGLAFAVLTGNLLAPLIDRYTVPRIYGHARR
jgi:electron transport complex protein RnfD